MKSRLFETGAVSEPFTWGLRDGFTPAQIKEGIIALLNPYILDKEVLERAAVGHLAGEAVCIARLSGRNNWKSMFEFCLATRREAIAKDKPKAFGILAAFQPLIIESQRKYVLQIDFEIPKEDLTTDQFAFELFRNIGSIVESTLQPFLKEFYCLAALCKGKSLISEEIMTMDFGKAVEGLEKLISDKDLVAPRPWNIRLSQWRNIAQHHSFKVSGDKITAQYGKSSPPKKIQLNRSELSSVAVEIASRLAIFRSTRSLIILNGGQDLFALMPTEPDDISAIATSLIASFATQGFTLINLQEDAGKVTASLIDAAPNVGEKRYIHCSQFLISVAEWFPDRDVEIQLRTQDNREHWVFSLDRKELTRLRALNDPLKGLADAIDWRKSLLIAQNNERNICKPT